MDRLRSRHTFENGETVRTYKDSSFDERRTAAANAKRAMAERFRAQQPGPDDAAVAQRQAKLRAISDAREARRAERKAVCEAETARRAAEEAARVAERTALAAEQVARDLALKAERKAARDARYAARKARR